MTRPPDAPKVIPASRTLAMLVSEIAARHAREWQAALTTAAQECGIDLERFAFDQSAQSWVDQTPEPQPEEPPPPPPVDQHTRNWEEEQSGAVTLAIVEGDASTGGTL